MRRTFMVLAGIATVGIGLAGAANPPFGGDDNGFLPPIGSAVNKCETNIGKQTAKLIDTVGKCHGKLITGKLDATGEEQCEQKATAKFVAKVKIVGCDVCTNLTTIANQSEDTADSALGAILCGAGTPAGGDDAGNIPADPIAAKCAAGVVKGYGKLNKALYKCHVNRAKGKLIDNAANEACETLAVNKFMSKTKTTGCDFCVNLGGVAWVTQIDLQAHNNLVYCQSPSSAFVEKSRGYMESLF